MSILVWLGIIAPPPPPPRIMFVPTDIWAKGTINVSEYLKSRVLIA